jgi:hypothetical protein
LARKQKQKIGVDRKFLNRIARRANQSPINLPDIDILDNQLEEARAQLRQYKKAHLTKRATWLENLAVAMVEHETGTNTDTEDFDVRAASYLKILKQREEQRNSARIIRRITRDSSIFQQVDHVQILSSTGDVTIFEEKNNLENALLEENQRRFNQAAESPFMTPPLSFTVGKFAKIQSAKEILQSGSVMHQDIHDH